MDPPTIHVIAGLSTPDSTATAMVSHELFFARRALKLLKDRLGREALESLLAKDIAAADTYWQNTLAASHGDFQLASVTLTATGLTTSAFLSWFRRNVPDLSVMQAAHPEHYVNGTTVLETVGTHVSLFELEFQDRPDGSVVENRDAGKYPIALCAKGVLRSGEVIGHACHQFRDLEGGNGLEGCFSGWLPAAVDAATVEMQTRHLAVEWANWMRVAHEDLKNSGAI